MAKGVNFVFDAKGTKEWMSALKKMARNHRVATGFMLNEMAFGSRTEAITRTFPRRMTVRNKNFIRAALRVKRTAVNVPTEVQESIFGSVFLGSASRFSGWAEQQFGRASKRDHGPTLLARGRTKKGVHRRRFRFTKYDQYLKTTDLRGKFKGPHHRAVVFIEMAKREKIRDPFFLFGHENFPNGLYILRGSGKKRRPVMLQTFDPSNRVKRVKWMTQSTGNYTHRTNLDALWEQIWWRVMLRIKKKHG
jgi:hypothetical protein